MALNDLSLSQLRNKKKEELLQLITDSRTAASASTTPKVVGGPSDLDHGPLLNQLVSIIKPLINDAVQELKTQLQALKTDFAALQAKVVTEGVGLSVPCDDDGDVSPGEGDASWSVAPGKKKKKSLPDMLRQSVCSALEEEKSKCDVIISRAVESQNDDTFMSTLCTTMRSSIKPTHLVRLGKKGSHPRLLKASFPTSFDARAFIAKYDEARKTKTGELPNIRMRSSKSGNELAAFIKSSNLAYKLNTQAREAKLNESYSVRDDGSIWKFAKEEDSGTWKRVHGWTPPPPEQPVSNPSGNEECST